MVWYKQRSAIISMAAIAFVSFALGASSGSSNSSSEPTNATTTPDTTQAATSEVTAEPKKVDVPAEHISALAQAKSYASTMKMSKQGVYDQLTSEYGGKFTAEAAQYAIDNVQADWNANALASAKNYQNTMHMSPVAIRDQLVSPYGGKFSEAEADYAIAHLND